MLKIQSIWEANGNIRDFAGVTPILHSQALQSDLGLQLFLKAENLQTTNSFKIRGASNCIVKQLRSTPNLQGVVTASSGNHGQAVAYVANRLGIPATIIMPETAPKAKVQAVSRWGANVEFCGTTSQQRLARSSEVALEKGYVEIPPYDHYDVIAGQGTIGKEILEQVPDVDIVAVPIGGGGLISGIATLIKNLRPKVQVIGVEPESSNSMSVSVNNGEITQLEKTHSAADGLLTLKPGSLTFPLVKKYVDKIVLVKEREILDAISTCVQYFKTVPEPSGAVTIAAALKGNWAKDMKVVAVVSGGNFDMEKLPGFLCPQF
ncbi:MAG: threonine ammonia-lyase [Clostridia bacterium]|jgi:threonine dehydratase|nr:threonine/serine dehydratase [Clostridiales bacterium]